MYVGPNQTCEIEQNIVEGSLKTLTVYFGDLINSQLSPSHRFVVSTDTLNNDSDTIESFLSTVQLHNEEIENIVTKEKSSQTFDDSSTSDNHS